MFAGKKSSVSRWIRLHKAIVKENEVIAVLKGNPRLASAFVLDNPYLVGNDNKMKLSGAVAAKVLCLLVGEIAAGSGITAAKFKSDLCRPAKKAEQWCKTMTSKFGSLATESPFFARVSESLFSITGLQRVLGTFHGEAVPLHGLSDSNPGIEECRKCVQELVKLKHPTPEQDQGV